MNRQARRASGVKNKKQEIALKSIQSGREANARGQAVIAERFFKLALQADSQNPIALLDLALNLYQRGHVGEAKTFFQKLFRVEPRNPAASFGLAMCAIDEGNTEEGLKLADRVLSMKPNAALLDNLGIMYREAGMKDKALDCLQKAIDAAPENPSPYFNLHDMHSFTADDPYFLNLLEIEKKENSLPLDKKHTLHFTLARAYMQMKDAEKAFHHYAEGNKFKKQGINYDVKHFENYVDRVISLFDESVVEKFKGAVVEEDTKRPIFIIGMPRSGSTLVDQILLSHPMVGSIGESPILSRCIPIFEEENSKGVSAGTPVVNQAFIEKLDADLLKQIGQDYLSKTADHEPDRPYLADKMLFNFLWVGLLRLALPGAKIIYCTRDPVDIGLSIWQNLFAKTGMLWAYDQNQIGRFYLAHRKMMAHWEKLFPGDVYEANYERIVNNQEEESRKLIEYCGLPWDDQCLRFFETERRVKTASAEQVRRPIYKDSMKKWKKYEPYLGELIETLGDEVDKT